MPKIFSVLLVLAISLFGSAQTANGSTAEDMTWVLAQNSDHLGQLIIHIHKDEVKVEKVGYYSIICKGPSWKVVLFNSQRRQMSERTLNDWLRRGLYSGLAFFDPPEGGHKREIDRKHGSMFMGIQVFNGAVLGSNPARRRYDAYFLVAPEITANVHVFEFLRRLLDVDIPLDCAVVSWKSHKGSQILMQSSAPNPERGLIRDLSTQEIKRVPYVAQDFARPENFRRVSDSDIVMGSKKDLIDDFMPP